MLFLQIKNTTKMFESATIWQKVWNTFFLKVVTGDMFHNSRYLGYFFSITIFWRISILGFQLILLLCTTKFKNFHYQYVMEEFLRALCWNKISGKRQKQQYKLNYKNINWKNLGTRGIILRVTSKTMYYCLQWLE